MEDGSGGSVLRLGAIPGAAPDRWVARWHDRHPEVRLQVDHFDDSGALDRVLHGVVDVGYLRVPAPDPAPGTEVGHGDGGDVGGDVGGDAVVDTEVFHRVWMYREAAVVCAARDHWVAAAEESVTWEDIAEETFLEPAEVAAYDPQSADGVGDSAELARAERLTLEVVASGTGLLVLPMSIARALSRKDVILRRIEDHPGYDVGLCWLRERDDEVIQEFIGVTRGRRADSARSTMEPVGASARSKSKPKPKPKSKLEGPGAGRRRSKGAARASDRGSGRNRPGAGREGRRAGRRPRR